MKRHVFFSSLILLLGAWALANAEAESAPSPSSIAVPETVGRVQEVFQGATGPVLIHIQDLHAHYGAQKNIAQIVDFFVKNYGLNLVLVEGGQGDVSLAYLRKYGGAENRRNVAERYLKEGQISGEEYLDIVSDYPLSLWGIEQGTLYDEGMKAFLKAEELRDPALAQLARLDPVIEALSAKIFSPAYREIAEKGKGFDAKKVSLAEWASYLKQAADKQGIDLSAYPNLGIYLQTKKMESGIDFKKVNDERTALIDKLTNELPKEELDSLVAKSLDFKAGKLTAGNFHGDLLKLAPKEGNAELRKYAEYVRLHETINQLAFFKEIDKLPNVLKEKLATSFEAGKLHGIAFTLDKLRTLLNLRLSPDEFRYYRDQPSFFLVKPWVQFLNDQSAKQGLGQTVEVNDEAINTARRAAEEFYAVAQLRDKVFVDNTMSKLQETNAPVAVLIAGGFHTPEITREFKAKGVSYVVVAPKVEGEQDQAFYHKVLKEKWRPGEWE